MKLLILLCLLCACGGKGPNLPDYKVLGNDLRVLALIADKPEASEGDSIIITPVLSDYGGHGRVLTYEAFACADPGIAYGAEPTCDRDPAKIEIGSGTVSGLSSPHYTGSATALSSFTIPSIGLGYYSKIKRYNGVDFLVTYKVMSTDGSAVSAYRTIKVSDSTKSTKNTNPAFTGNAVLANNSAMTAEPTQEVYLKADYTSASVSTFPVMRDDGSVEQENQEMLITWFVSHGKLLYTHTVNKDTNRYNPDRGNPNPWVMVVIMRDKWGGTAVTTVKGY